MRHTQLGILRDVNHVIAIYSVAAIGASGNFAAKSTIPYGVPVRESLPKAGSIFAVRSE